MTRRQQLGYALILVSVLTGITWAISQFVQPILPANINNSVIFVLVRRVLNKVKDRVR